ncbi:MAG: uracil-DNA glycosylase family protein [Hyphomicrobiaceae bacterium]
MPALTRLVSEIRACRLCVETPRGRPLAQAPRPVLRPSSSARLAIAGQAPGARVHASGVPFTDPSGVRLRAWMGVTDDEFYDDRRIAILPMGFCFPGHDAKGGDLPPRKECAAAWRKPLLAAMPQLELILLVGSYAIDWHLLPRRRQGLTATVADFEAVLSSSACPRHFPLPHPSWRNNAWIRTNSWFETGVLPRLRAEVRRLL